MDLQDMKKKFESRCEEFKKQMAEFKNNNEAIEALKKAHQKELAAHVQAHNTKYNDLLQQKLNSEDALKAQAEQEKRSLALEWENRLKQAVAAAKQEEQRQAEIRMKKVVEDYDEHVEMVESKLKAAKETIE